MDITRKENASEKWCSLKLRVNGNVPHLDHFGQKDRWYHWINIPLDLVMWAIGQTLLKHFINIALAK